MVPPLFGQRLLEWQRVSVPVLVCVFFCTGCGVSEYGKEFEKQQQRIAEFDKENSLLDLPVELPPGKDPKGTTKLTPAPEIFFRVPQGISNKADGRFTGPVYYFPNLKNLANRNSGGMPVLGATQPFSPQGSGPPSGKRGTGIQAVFLAVDKDKKRDQFLTECALQASFFSLIDGTKTMEKSPLLTPYGRPPMQYDTVTLTAPPSTYYFYLYQGTPPFIVAVVYEVETNSEGEMNEFRQKIQYSLQSLILGEGAQEARQKFKGP